MTYEELIAKKSFNRIEVGFVPASLNANLKPHQEAIVNWACQRGRAAIFADTGLGKSLMQLEWANQVSHHTGKPVIIFAPLAVGKQTEGEANKFCITSKARYMRQFDGVHRIVVTNYEMIDNFNPSEFAGIVLDESSILKGQSGAYRKKLTDFATNIPYRLSCTATPSPNDFMELGTQAEFLGIMSQAEMLAMFFTHDGSETQKWRLKGHGASKFWDWLATWSVVISSPADLGFDGAEYELPPLTIHEVILPSTNDGQLVASIANGLSAARDAKRSSIEIRVKACADMINSTDDDWLIWGELNAETDMLAEMINDAVQVQGSDKIETKEDRLLGFAAGKYKRLVSKASICGFGMNWQHTNKMAFVGPTYSFEQFYQAVRRQWRFGQTKPVDVYVFMTEEETGIHSTMLGKMENDKLMRREMINVMGDAMRKEITGAKKTITNYEPARKARLPAFL
jgi:hypothetical protein